MIALELGPLGEGGREAAGDFRVALVAYVEWLAGAFFDVWGPYPRCGRKNRHPTPTRFEWQEPDPAFRCPDCLGSGGGPGEIFVEPHPSWRWLLWLRVPRAVPLWTSSVVVGIVDARAGDLFRYQNRVDRPPIMGLRAGNILRGDFGKVAVKEGRAYLVQGRRRKRP